MNAMKTSITIVLVMVMLSCLGCKRVPEPNVAVVLDSSASTTEVRESCMGIVNNSFDLPGINKGSRLLIMATGDKKTANEPILLAEYRYPAPARRAMENRARQNHEHETEFMGRVQLALESFDDQSQRTAIYIAFQRALQSLQEQDCGQVVETNGLFGEDSVRTCFLYAVTDGEENQEQALTEMLRRTGNGQVPAEMVLDNENIEIIFCGLASTSGATAERNHAHILRLETVWKSAFSNPDLVHFQPFCPRWEEGE
jgi:hypothetical protein